MSRPVFISHAVANKDLADKLVDLLETGIGINDNKIFCSSLEGMGIPSGKNFIGFIHGEISQPEAVILLLSQQYFESQFCLCELGAAWALAHRMIPLLVPPLEFKNVKAVLQGVQMLRIDDGDSLNQMREDLLAALSLEGKIFARWEAKRNLFLAAAKNIVANAPARKSVTLDEYETLKEKYEGAVAEIQAMESESEKKDDLIEKLKSAKDAEEVKEIVSRSSDDFEAFETLVEEAEHRLRALPSIVVEAVYYHFRGECLPWADPYDNARRDEINQAIEEDYIEPGDEGCDVVDEDPRIGDALSALNDLQRFVDKKSEENEFSDQYVCTYNHRLNLASRRFWETHLGLG